MINVEDITLWNGDCLELMRDISDKSIDCIICDLPYGTTACKWDTIIPFEPLWEQYNRIIKDNGAILLFGSEPFSSKLRLSNIKMYKYDWYWNKTKPVGFANAKKMPLKDVEIISVFYKKLPDYSPQGLIECNKIIDNSTKTKKQNNITAINGGAFKTKTFMQQHTNYPRQILKFSVEQGLHPTQKPVPLIEYLIKTYTNEGEVILDNCMGSGTTGVACLNTNRKFIGIELDNTYYNIAKDRIEKQEYKIKT